MTYNIKTGKGLSARQFQGVVSGRLVLLHLISAPPPVTKNLSNGIFQG